MMLSAFALRLCAIPAVILSIVALSATPGNAAIGVTPLSAALGPGEMTASFTVSNPDSVERVVQLEISRWQHGDGGNDVLTKTSDWIVSPPVIQIPALGSRVVRIGLRRRVPATEEVSYRLVLSEVRPHTDRSGLGVAVNTHVSLPVFIVPITESKKKPEWSASRDAASHIVVTLKNAGPTHVHLSFFTLRDPSGKTLETSAPSYVFSGETRTWTLVLDKSVPDPRNLIVEAHTDTGVQTIPIASR